VEHLRPLPWIGRRRAFGQKSLQAGTQRLEHPQDFRTVFA
jgi:hypothetical protein